MKFPPLNNALGFGLLMVMVGAMVIGILSVSYMRKTQNRTATNKIYELVDFGNQVLDYYTAVAESRTAWQCTLKCNLDLKRYVEGGGATCSSSSSNWDSETDRSSDGCKINLYDGDGNCQSVSTRCDSGAGKPTMLISSNGFRLSLEDDNSDSNDGNDEGNFRPPRPAPSGTPDANKPFLVRAKWMAESDSTKWGTRAVNLTISVDWRPNSNYESQHTTIKIKDRSNAIPMNRTPSRSCAYGLAGLHDKRGTGVKRFAGDSAVVSVDGFDGTVSCHKSLGAYQPLIVPPCYGLDLPLSDNIFKRTPANSDSSNIFDFVADKACQIGSGDLGLCPKTTDGGTTAITNFDRFTGISHCSREHILIEENTSDRDSTHEKNCQNGGLVEITSSGQLRCNPNPNVRGVEKEAKIGTPNSSYYSGGGYHCPYGIKGWDGNGNVVCANSNPGGSSNHELPSPHRGYFVGDDGETGNTGNNLKSCNCCNYPRDLPAGAVSGTNQYARESGTVNYSSYSGCSMYQAPCTPLDCASRCRLCIDKKNDLDRQKPVVDGCRTRSGKKECDDKCNDSCQTPCGNCETDCNSDCDDCTQRKCKSEYDQSNATGDWSIVERCRENDSECNSDCNECKGNCTDKDGNSCPSSCNDHSDCDCATKTAAYNACGNYDAEKRAFDSACRLSLGSDCALCEIERTACNARIKEAMKFKATDYGTEIQNGLP